MFFGVALVLTIIFVGVYTAVTHHNEIKLIRENSVAAAIAISGSLVGFALPLASAMIHSVSIIELAIWGVVAIVVQVIVYFIVRLPMPGLSKRIEDNEVAAGTWLGAASLVGGILNAASMTP